MGERESLATRIKGYEAVTHYTATHRIPLMIRVDGRAFHTLTRGMEKPFDRRIMDAMSGAARQVAHDMQGFKAAYVQSDEASFCVTDYDRVNSEGWFDYDLSKIISISASLMSVEFNRLLGTKNQAVFDSRAFSVPATDVVNAFLWRAQDWSRNSLSMYARAHFSHRQLHRKNANAIHEMLHSIGENWTTDITPRERNGVFLIALNGEITERHDVLPTHGSISNVIGHLFEYPSE